MEFRKDLTVNPLGKEKKYPLCRIKGNDPLNYALDEQMIKDMASFPYSQPVGGNLGKSSTATPGIAICEMTPSFSDGGDFRKSAINQAFNTQFTYITQGYTGTNPSFQAADLGVYCQAVYALIDPLIEMKRVYAVMKKYSNYNKYFGRALVTALGFDYDDMMVNMANIRAKYNIWIDKINKTLRVPKDSKIVKHRSELYSRLFADSLGSKYQIFAFRPSCYLKFDAYAAGGSSLKYEMRPSVMTVAQYFEKLESILDPLFGNDDINIMSGALFRVYGESGCIQYSSLDEASEIPIEFDHIIAQQFHNLEVYPTTVVNNTLGSSGATGRQISGDIKSMNSGYALYQVNGRVDGRLYYNDPSGNGDPLVSQFTFGHIIDAVDEVPQPGLTLDITRYKVAYEKGYDVSTNTYRQFIVAGSEFCSDLKIYYFSNPLAEDSISWVSALTSITDENTYNTDFITSVMYLTDDAGNTSVSLRRTSSGWIAERLLFSSKMSAFDYAPFQIISTSGAKSSAPNMEYIGDIYNFTIISDAQLALMNSQSWYGLLSVPPVVDKVTR